MEMVPDRFNKQYRSSPEVSRLAAQDIFNFLQHHGVVLHVIEQVELCLVEIVNNAYEHAYFSQNDKIIEVSCWLHFNSVIKLDVSDYGEAISLEYFEQAVQGEFIEPDPDEPMTWVTSGRGFIIVAQLSDHLNYVRRGDKNTFTISKLIKTST